MAERKVNAAVGTMIAKENKKEATAVLTELLNQMTAEELQEITSFAQGMKFAKLINKSA